MIMDVDQSETQRSANNLFLLITHSSNGDCNRDFSENVTSRQTVLRETFF